MRMLAEDELRDAVLLIFANKQVCIPVIIMMAIAILINFYEYIVFELRIYRTQ